MTKTEEILFIAEQTHFKPSSLWSKVFIFLAAVGVLTFGLSWFYNPANAYQALLVNTIFFGGLSLSGLMFSVIATVTDAFWLRPMKRFAEATTAFSLVAFICFIILFFGNHYLFAWSDPELVMYSKAGWLQMPFFIARHLIAYLFLGVFVVIFLKNSIVPDLLLSKSLHLTYKGSFFDRFVHSDMDLEHTKERSYKSNKYLAPFLGFIFGLVSTLVAFDWIMSIDQSWFSTMFGVQYLVANLIAGGAFLIIVSAVARSKWNIGEYQTNLRHHDLSKLTFALTLLWTYMIFSQVLVIWYANIPEETPYMILRMKSLEWGWMFWLLFFVVFIIPFFGLMSRTACRSPLFSSIVACDLLVGLWLEKYFLVVPSMQENMAAHGDHGHGAGLPGLELSSLMTNIGVGLGMLGIFLLLYTSFLSKVPALPISDHRLFKPDQH